MKNKCKELKKKPIALKITYEYECKEQVTIGNKIMQVKGKIIIGGLKEFVCKIVKLFEKHCMSVKYQ